MACQVFVCDGVKADDVEADALVVARDDVIHRRIIKAGIVAKVGIRPPALVPAEVEEQKIGIFRVFAVLQDALERDGLALVQVAALDNERLADELRGGERVERRAAGEQMRGRVHVCARVGVHGQLRLLEAVLFIGVRAGENGCLRAGIDRHIFSDGVGQVKHAHGNIFLSVEIKIRTRTAPAAYSTPCRPRWRAAFVSSTGAG